MLVHTALAGLTGCSVSPWHHISSAVKVIGRHRLCGLTTVYVSRSSDSARRQPCVVYERDSVSAEVMDFTAPSTLFGRVSRCRLLLVSSRTASTPRQRHHLSSSILVGHQWALAYGSSCLCESLTSSHVSNPIHSRHRGMAVRLPFELKWIAQDV